MLPSNMRWGTACDFDRVQILNSQNKPRPSLYAPISCLLCAQVFFIVSQFIRKSLECKFGFCMKNTKGKYLVEVHLPFEIKYKRYYRSSTMCLHAAHVNSFDTPDTAADYQHTKRSALLHSYRV